MYVVRLGSGPTFAISTVGFWTNFSFVFSIFTKHTGETLFCGAETINKWTVRFWTKMNSFWPKIGPEPSRLLGPESNRPKCPFFKINWLKFLWNHYKILFSEKQTWKEANQKTKTFQKHNFSHCWKQRVLKKTLCCNSWLVGTELICETKARSKESKW